MADIAFWVVTFLCPLCLIISLCVSTSIKERIFIVNMVRQIIFSIAYALLGAQITLLFFCT